MTAEQKSKDLINKFYFEIFQIESDISQEIAITLLAKQCALIAVNIIIKQCWDYRDIDVQASYDYWQEVKQEIKKL